VVVMCVARHWARPSKATAADSNGRPSKIGGSSSHGQLAIIYHSL
jgi:hypothetical protein